jgi:hypothetical protein
MNRRRFIFLAVALVALTALVWAAQGGSALPPPIIKEFFGNRMVRAEVLVQAPDGSTQDWRIDRGVITAVAGTTITLRERNGDVVPLQVDPNAQVRGPLGRSITVAQLRRRMRVVVFRQANAPAQLVQVEGFGG